MKKIVIIVIIILIGILGIGAVLYLNSCSNEPSETEFKIGEVFEDEENQKYKYSAFVPTFRNSSESTHDDYDFTNDMTWVDGIYYKKINTYNEYELVKKRWPGVLDMAKSDFETKFMVITAIENTSMVGLKVNKIEEDENNLYINLKHYDEDETFNREETCISYVFSRDFERNNIIVNRDLLDNEKEFKNDMWIGKNTKREKYNNRAYEILRSHEKRVDWKMAQIERGTVLKSMPEIDFSNWKDLGNEFYSYEFKNISEYQKFAKAYDLVDLTWYDFQDEFLTVVVRKASDRSVEISDIETENGKDYITFTFGGIIDVAADYKYPIWTIAMPNYRMLDENKVELRILASEAEKSKEIEVRDNITFECEVTGVTRENIYVNATDESSGLTKYNDIVIDIQKYKNDFYIGQKLKITYDGTVETTSPVQIKAKNIEEIK